jgi:hypothetical protein
MDSIFIIRLPRHPEKPQRHRAYVRALTLLETVRTTCSTAMPATVNHPKLLDFRAIMPDLIPSMPAEPLGPSPDLMLNSGGFFYAHIPESREADR